MQRLSVALATILATSACGRWQFEQDPPYDPRWQRLITLGLANDFDPVSRVPLLLVLRKEEFSLQDVRSDLADLRFVDEDGALLSYEVARELSSERDALVWVLVPQLQPNSQITMTYGDPSAPPGENPAQTWADFVAVLHFDDETNLKNSANGQLEISAAPATMFAAEDGETMGLAARFRGVSATPTEWIRIKNHPSLDSSNLTVSAMVKQTGRSATDSLNDSQTVFGRPIPGSIFNDFFAGYYLDTAQDQQRAYFGQFRSTGGMDRTSVPAPRAADLPTQIWEHLSIVKAPGKFSLSVNGMEVWRRNESSIQSGGPVMLGSDIDNATAPNAGVLNGFVDEFRISQLERSKEYLVVEGLAARGTLAVFEEQQPAQ